MIEIRPQPGPQTEFLSTPADIAIYGGAAGGGKTWALLLEALRHIDVPNFSWTVFRRTFPQITSPGALWDESQKLFPLAGGEALRATLTWRFPRGTWGRFSHLQHESDVLDWQGAQIPFIGFDELTHFTEYQFFYLLSRNRSVCGVKPYIRATTNPDGASWVKVFLAPWVDKNYPGKPAMSGEIRWFIRVNGEIVWLDTEEEAWKFAMAQAYVGPDGRMVPVIPKSVTFIRASVFDNRILLQTNPEYVANLLSLPPVERARLLDGDWDILTDRFFKEWLPSLPGGYPWHVIPTTEVDSATRKYCGIDYGYAAPWAAYLCGVEGDGRVVVYRELYGAERKASEQARDLNKLLDDASTDRYCTKYAGHDAFAAQRHAEGRQEPIEEIWRRAGMKNIIEAGRDPLARAAKLREFLESWGEVEGWPQGRPGIQIMDCCKNLIRTLPLLKNDEHNPEIVDTKMEDHGFDALTHFLTSRPGKPRHYETKETVHKRYSRKVDSDEPVTQESEDEYR